MKKSIKVICIVILIITSIINTAYGVEITNPYPIKDLEYVKEIIEANKPIYSIFCYDNLKLGEAKNGITGGKYISEPDSIEHKKTIYELKIEKEGMVKVKAIATNAEYSYGTVVRIFYISKKDGTKKRYPPIQEQMDNSTVVFYGFPGTYYISVDGSNYTTAEKKGVDNIYLNFNIIAEEEKDMILEDILPDEEILEKIYIDVYDAEETGKLMNARVILNGKTSEIENGNRTYFKDVKKNKELPIEIEADGYVSLKSTIFINPEAKEGTLKFFYLEKEKTIDLTTASPWAVEELQDAFEEGIFTKKITKGDFKDYATREEFCELVMKVYDIVGGKSIKSNYNPFNDTNNTEVIRAYNAGIINGTSATTFGPDGTLTREQLCVMIVNTIKAISEEDIMYDYIDFQKKYDDLDKVSPWAYDAMKILNYSEIINGYEHKLLPKEKVSKEAAIILLLRTGQEF